MKRGPDEDAERGSSTDSEAEQLLRRLVQKHSRLLLYVGIALGALIVIAFAVAKYAGLSR